MEDAAEEPADELEEETATEAAQDEAVVEEEVAEVCSSASARRRRKKSRRLSRHKERRGRFRHRRHRSWRGRGWRARRGGGSRRGRGRKGRGKPRRGCRQHGRGCGRVRGPIRGGATRTSSRSRTATVLPGETRTAKRKSQAQLYNETFGETGKISGCSEEEKKAHQKYLADLKVQKDEADREARAKKEAAEKAKNEARAAAAAVADRRVGMDNVKVAGGKRKVSKSTTKQVTHEDLPGVGKDVKFARSLTPYFLLYFLLVVGSFVRHLSLA